MNPTARRLALQELYGLVHEAASAGAFRHVNVVGLSAEQGLALARDLAQMLQGAGRRLVVVEADLGADDPITAALRLRFALARDADVETARQSLRAGLQGLVTAARIEDAVTLLAGLLGTTRALDGTVAPGLEPALVRSARFRTRAVKTALNLLRYDAARTPHLFLVPANPSGRAALELAQQLSIELRERPVCFLSVGEPAPELPGELRVVQVGEPAPEPTASLDGATLVDRVPPALMPTHPGRAAGAPTEKQRRAPTATPFDPPTGTPSDPPTVPAPPPLPPRASAASLPTATAPVTGVTAPVTGVTAPVPRVSSASLPAVTAPVPRVSSASLPAVTAPVPRVSPASPPAVTSPVPRVSSASLPTVTEPVLGASPRPGASLAAAGPSALRTALGPVPEGAWQQVLAAGGDALTPPEAHRIVADWLEGHQTGEVDIRATHLARGDRPERAAELLLAAGALSVERAQRALSLVPRGHQTLGRRAARLGAALGHAWGNAEVLQAALPWLDASPLRVLAQRDLGQPADWGDGASSPADPNLLDDTLWWVEARLGDTDAQALPAVALRLEQALKRARGAGDPVGVGRVLVALAALRADEGKLVLATSHYDEALALLSPLRTPELVSAAWLGLHTVRRARGEEQAADEALEQAGSAAPAGHPTASRVALAEANQLIALNRLDEARTLLDAVPAWGVAGLEAERLAACSSLAAVSGQAANARSLSAAALEKARAAGHPSVLARALLASAQSHTMALFSPGADTGHAAAIAGLREASALLDTTGRHRELLTVLEALSRCCLEAGDMAGARASSVRVEALRQAMMPTDHAERALRESRTIRRTYTTSPIAPEDVSNILSQISAPSRKSRVDF